MRESLDKCLGVYFRSNPELKKESVHFSMIVISYVRARALEYFHLPRIALWKEIFWQILSMTKIAYEC